MWCISSTARLASCFCFRVRNKGGIPFNIKFKTEDGPLPPPPVVVVKQVKEICFDALKCMQISLK